MPRSRPPKLTPEVAKTIVEAVSIGVPIETAAHFAKVSRSTVYAWQKRGEREKSGIYRDLLDKIKHAHSSVEVRHLGLVTHAASKHWQASTWLLERLFPERYGPKQQIKLQLEAEIGRVLDRAKELLPEDAYEQFLAAVASDQGEESVRRMH